MLITTLWNFVCLAAPAAVAAAAVAVAPAAVAVAAAAAVGGVQAEVKPFCCVDFVLF